MPGSSARRWPNPFFLLSLDPTEGSSQRVREALSRKRQEWLHTAEILAIGDAETLQHIQYLDEVEQRLANPADRDRLATEAQRLSSAWTSAVESCQQSIDQLSKKGYLLDSEVGRLVTQVEGAISVIDLYQRTAAALARSAASAKRFEQPDLLAGENHMAQQESPSAPIYALFIRLSGHCTSHSQPSKDQSADVYRASAVPVATIRSPGYRPPTVKSGAGRRSTLWLLGSAGVIVLAALTISLSLWIRGSGFQHSRASTLDNIGLQREVNMSLAHYFHLVAYATRTNDCSGLASVSIDPALAQERAVCAHDSAAHAYKVIRNLSPPQFVRIRNSGGSATAVVRKDQDILFVYADCGVPDDLDLCGHSGPSQTRRHLGYSTTYYLIHQQGKWLISQAVLESYG